MGTNYFCTLKDNKKIHIGKNSCGWAFLFHGYTDENNFIICSYSDWQKFLSQKGLRIVDEAGVLMKKKDFFMLIDISLSYKKMPVLNNQESWSDEPGFTFLNKYFS